MNDKHQTTLKGYETLGFANYYLEKNGAKREDLEMARSFGDQLVPNSSVLDLGCGPGHLAKEISDKGHKVIAVDYSAEMINLAKSKFEESENLHFEVLDVFQSDRRFQDNSLHGIFAAAFFVHFSKTETRELIQMLLRKLKSKGTFLISLKAGQAEDELVQSKLTINGQETTVDRHFTYWDEHEFISMLNQLGIKNVSVKKIHSVDTAGVPTTWMQFWIKKD